MALRKLQQPSIAAGKEIYAKFLSDNGIDDDNDTITKATWASSRPRAATTSFYMLGNQEIVLNEFVAKTLRRQNLSTARRLFNKILRRKEKEEQAEIEQENARKRAAINRKETYILRYDENGNSNFHFSDCCNPLPGDDVLGFIEDNGEVAVHSLDCPRANALKASFGPRILSTRWETGQATFPTHIHIEGIDLPRYTP